MLVRRANINHALHLLISLLTCGLWVFGWLIWVAVQRDSRKILAVSEVGQLSETPASG